MRCSVTIQVLEEMSSDPTSQKKTMFTTHQLGRPVDSQVLSAAVGGSFGSLVRSLGSSFKSAPMIKPLSSSSRSLGTSTGSVGSYSRGSFHSVSSAQPLRVEVYQEGMSTLAKAGIIGGSSLATAGGVALWDPARLVWR